MGIPGRDMVERRETRQVCKGGSDTFSNLHKQHSRYRDLCLAWEPRDEDTESLG